MPGHNSRDFITVSGAFAIAAVLAAAAFFGAGTGAEAMKKAVKVSAIFSFLPFFVAYSNSRLRALFGNSLFSDVTRYGRELGLAFAAALSVHLGCVILLINFKEYPFSTNFLIFSELFGVLWVYALAVLSFARARERFSPTLIMFMRTWGMDYIAVIFAINFAPSQLRSLLAPLFLLASAAIALRLIDLGRRLA